MRPRSTPPPEPTDPQGFTQRGNRFSRNAAYEQAIQDYSRAIELDQGFAEAYFHRGVSFFELRRYDEAIGDLTQAIALKPTDDSAYSRRALAYLLTDRLELAQADEEKCEELRGGSPG